MWSHEIGIRGRTKIITAILRKGLRGANRFAILDKSARGIVVVRWLKASGKLPWPQGWKSETKRSDGLAGIAEPPEQDL